MILSDRQIRTAIDRGDIEIEPFDLRALGTNSYDVHLGDVLLVYQDVCLDAAVDNPAERLVIPPSGFVLCPQMLYLGVTKEYTRTRRYVPFLDGKSSAGRLGITIHCTAGRGDVGFAGHWTMEIHVVHPVRVYAGMPIGQLIYFETGDVDVSYDRKLDAKYRDGRIAEPQTSRMWRNFPDGFREP